MSATYADILEIAATDIFANVGGFTVSTVSNISTITVPNSGLFKLTCHVKIVTAQSNRAQLYMRVNVLRSGVVVPDSNTIMGGAYVRGQPDAQSGIASGTTTLLLGLGDTINFQMVEEGNTANTYTFGGSDSVVEIIEIPSELVGIAGPAGAAYSGETLFGAVDPVASDGADKDTWWNTTASPATLWKKAAGAWTKMLTLPAAGGVVVVDHDNYVGWSDDRVIADADFDTAVDFDTDTTTLGAQTTAAYIWFGRRESLDDPTSLIIGANPADQLGFYQKLAGTVTRDSIDYEIWVTYVTQSADLAGQTFTLGFS